MRRFRRSPLPSTTGPGRPLPIDCRSVRLHLAEVLLPERSMQPVDEAFEFLLTLADLPERRRRALRLWLEGSTLAQVARSLGITSQATCRHVQLGLLELHALAPLAFAASCRRPVYRAPSRPSGIVARRKCRWCGYTYRAVEGQLTYCCDDCRTQARAARLARAPGSG